MNAHAWNSLYHDLKERALPLGKTEVDGGRMRKNILFSFFGGFLIALLTGLVPIRSLDGAIHYGVPLAWRILTYLDLCLVSSDALIADAMFWMVIVFSCTYLWRKFR